MENHKKHSLGHRAFFIFLLKRIWPVILFGAIAGGAWYVFARWIAATSYAPWGWYAVEILLIIAAAVFLMVLLRTYIEYKVYSYMFTEEAFVMTFGYFVHNEVTALYHQIQGVNIQRSPGDRFGGVSKVVIMMAGADRDSDRSKIILPSIAKKKAKLVQQELLMRARRHMPGYEEVISEPTYTAVRRRNDGHNDRNGRY